MASKYFKAAWSGDSLKAEIGALIASHGITNVSGGPQLVGDFNGWSRSATPLRREGAWFTAEVDLEPDRTYRYRYLLDGDRWENDWSADAYAPNPWGSEDSVVRT